MLQFNPLPRKESRADPPRQLFQSRTLLCDVVLNISALPARTIGKVFDQLSPSKPLTYWGTVLEGKGCVSGDDGQISLGSDLNHSMSKLVIFVLIR